MVPPSEDDHQPRDLPQDIIIDQNRSVRHLASAQVENTIKTLNVVMHIATLITIGGI